MLFAVGPSIIKFGNDCFNYYGNIVDPDISNLIFCKCAAFEIALRGQANKERQNKNIPHVKLNLEKPIDELCLYNNIPANEKEILQGCRNFINMVKGHKPPSWQDGIIAFELAWNICGKYRLRIN